MELAHTQDHILLHRWQQGRDAEAFRALVERYAGLVFAAAHRVLRDATDAEDVSQDCFVTLAQSPKVPAGNLGAWLHTVAVNRAKDHIRGAARRRKREDTHRQMQPKTVETELDDTLIHVDEAIAQLDDELRHAIVAHFLEGKSQGEIAANTGVSRQTVNARVKRGIEAVREELRKRGIATTSASLGAVLATQMVEAAPATLVASLGKVALSGGVTAGGTGSLSAMLNLLSAKVLIGAAAAVAIVGAMLVVLGGLPPTGTPAAEHDPIASTIASESDVPDAGDATDSSTPDLDVALTAGQPGDEPQGAVIRGTLLDRMDAPMEGVTVVAEGEGGERSTKVGPDGTFQMEDVPPGAYTLSARKKGYNIESRGNESIEFVSVSANIDVSHQSVSDVAMQCDCEPALVSGRLVDEQGNGVPDVPVRLESAPGERKDLSVGIQNLETRTDAQGDFELHVYGPTHFWMYARGGDWTIDGPVVVRTGETGLRIAVKSKGRGLFRMRVVDGSKGDPVECYRYEFRGKKGRLHFGEVQDPDGRASSRIAIDDFETLVVRVPEMGAAEHRLQASDIGGPEQILRLQPYPAITGVVRNSAGQPIAGVRIQPFEPRFDHSSREPLTLTDGDGQFSIPNPEPSLATLYAVGDHYPDVEFEAIRDRNLHVVLPEASRITGAVMASGMPMANVKIQVSRSLNHRQSRLVKREAKTDAEGRYELAGLPAGTYRVEVTRPDADGTIYLGEPSQRVTVLEGEALISDFTFEARSAPAALTGTILEGGESVPGRIQLVMSDTTGKKITDSAEATATDGYTMKNLLTGSVEIVAKRSGRERRMAYNLHPGENHLDIEFPSGRATLECDVTLDHEAIVAVDYELTMETEAGTEVVRETDYHLTPSGLQIGNLPGGSGRLVVTLNHHVVQRPHPFALDVVITPGETTYVQLPGPEFSAELLVDVIHRAGLTPAGVHVYAGAMYPDDAPALTYEQYRERRGQFEEVAAAGSGEGAIHFEALAPGTYTVVAFARREGTTPQPGGPPVETHLAAQFVTLEDESLSEVTLTF